MGRGSWFLRKNGHFGIMVFRSEKIGSLQNAIYTIISTVEQYFSESSRVVEKKNKSQILYFTMQLFQNVSFVAFQNR